jgi:hypothetical protein
MKYEKNDIIKLGGIKIPFYEIEKEFFNNNNQYIVKYKTVYQVFYGVNVGMYAEPLHYNHNNGVGYTLKGRYIWADAQFINRLVGFKLLNE